MGLWEQLNNPNFKGVEFDPLLKEAGSNAFTMRRRLTQRRSCEQESFDVIAEKETDLKMKRLFRPRRITIELLPNVKGMGVILHGLCPVTINR